MATSRQGGSASSKAPARPWCEDATLPDHDTPSTRGISHRAHARVSPGQRDDGSYDGLGSFYIMEFQRTPGFFSSRLLSRPSTSSQTFAVLCQFHTHCGRPCQCLFTRCCPDVVPDLRARTGPGPLPAQPRRELARVDQREALRREGDP